MLPEVEPEPSTGGSLSLDIASARRRGHQCRVGRNVINQKLANELTTSTGATQLKTKTKLLTRVDWVKVVTQISTLTQT